MPVSRRRFIQTAGVGGTVALAGCSGNGGNGGNGGGGNGGTAGNGGGSSADEVVIGTMTPLTGPFARDGTLVKKGVDFAVNEINTNGGIKALDGAKIRVVSVDTGESTSTATSAAQSLYSNHNPSAAVGSWLSSQTIATTSVSERNQVPQLTLSYSDKIVNRGYSYVFQTVPMASEFASQTLSLTRELAKEKNSPIRKVALVGDNTASSTFTFEPLRNDLIPNTEQIELVVDKVWTPTLSDATPIVRALKQQEPDMMFFSATAFPDSLAILRKMQELNVQLPTVGIGAWLTLPAYVNNIGVELTKNIMAVTGGHPLKGQLDLVRRFSNFADEPFMIQDSIVGYANAHIIKAAIEASGSTDPTEIRKSLSNMNLTEGPAVSSLPVDQIQFRKNGHMKNAQVLMTQWKKKGDADWIGTPAAPFTVYPAKYQMRNVNWVPADYS